MSPLCYIRTQLFPQYIMASQNSLFSIDFLDSYLTEFQLSSIVNIYKVKEIIKNWNEAISNGKLENLKEEEIKSRFLMEVLGDVLGFNYKNTGKWLYREELKTNLDGTKPDGALGLFYISENGIENEVQIIIEVKDANSFLDKPQNRQAFKITPVDQAFLYASKMGGDCQWVIVTNLREIRIYSACDQTRYQQYTIPGLLDENKLKEFLFLFHKDRFFTGGISPTSKLLGFQKHNKKRVLKHHHIVDELYFCLKRFDQLSYIDPEFIANTKPFNILDVRVWHYTQFNLFTLNPEIHNLLKGLQVNKGNLIIRTDLENELKSKDITEYRMKLEYIFKKLSQSYVRRISVLADMDEHKRKDNAVFKQSYRHPVPITKDNGITFDLDYPETGNCECINCLYRSLDFRRMIKHLDAMEGKKESETLEYAYGHYLIATDNYKKAFRVYKNIENESKGNDKRFIEYFIVKRNLLNIQHLFFDDPEYADFKKENRTIDLDRVLSNEIDLFVDEDVRKLLLDIKDDKIFNNSIAKSVRLLKEIKDLKSFYAMGGEMYSGPNYVNNLSQNYLYAYGHIHKNCIIQDAYSTYSELVASLFQGLVYSYQTKGAGIEKFGDFFLIETMLYVSPDKLKEILQDVNELPMDDSPRQTLISKTLAFFQSGYQDGIFGDPTFDALIERQLLNYVFRDKYTNVFSNICKIFCYINFTSAEFDSLSQALVKFLKSEQVLAWYDIERFGQLIKKSGSLFSSKQLLELLSLAISSHRYATNNKYETLIRAIPIALKKFNPDVLIEDSHLVKRVVLNCYLDDNRANLSILTDLWHVLNSANRKFLTDAFEEYLDKDFNDHLYEHLLKNRVIGYDRKEYLMKYAEYVNLEKRNGFTGFKNGKPQFNDLVCYNFLLVPYILDIAFDLPEFKMLENLSPFETWLASPFNFDYENFKVEWLKVVQSSFVLARLKGNENIRTTLNEELKLNFDKQLAKVYFKYFSW